MISYTNIYWTQIRQLSGLQLYTRQKTFKDKDDLTSVAIFSAVFKTPELKLFMVFLIGALFYYFSKVILKPLHSKFGQRVAQNNYFFYLR